MGTLLAILTGMVAMSFLIASLFFLRFWLRTRDNFFLLFAAAFAVYGADQFFLGWAANSEDEPLFYLPRLVTFGLIVLAVINKNRSASKR
ncbi:MAG TPA: DUF5985 family protein [Rhizomicrobium sp.]|jgi:hypothetical protein|nr:DUF5985 family protein [Rhizomicrobium sp.]